MRSHEVAWLIALSLAGCASRRLPGDDAPTLASLAGRQVQVTPDAAPPPRDEARAIAAYQAYLAAAPASAAQRSEAMRRLGDLEMELADKRTADGAVADYRAAIERYQAYLAAHPNAADRDGVLYQLARAQEQGGALELALATLDQLVRAHPQTRHRDEAEFRRGELLFSKARWAEAEAAFGTVLQAGAGNPYLDRALYMQGWARYKQGRLADALEALFGVLDLELGPARPLSRADQELVDDTLRVVSLALEGLQGAASVEPLVQGPLRLGYEDRVYEHLAELYQRQGRSKDAADTFGRFARLRPQHPKAPEAHSRAIAILQDAGFEALALQAKQDFVSSYADTGPDRASAAWRAAQPRVRQHLAELAQHHHAQAQRSHAAADVETALRWYRAALRASPDGDAAPGQRFLLGELLFEAGRFAEALPEYEAAADAVPHAKAADAAYAALLTQSELLRRAAGAEQPALQRAQLDGAQRFAERFGNDERVGGVLAHAADNAWTLHDGTRAAMLAQQVLSRSGAAAHRRVAFTLLGHLAFDAGDFAAAEAQYAQALALAPAGDGARAALTERLAAAVYRQGEAARDGGRTREAADHFARVQQQAPAAAAAVAARFDAAVQWMALQEWSVAALALSSLRQQHPQHPLAAEVPARLALVYTKLGRHAAAAEEYERLAATLPDPDAARSAAWQAAELFDRADDATQAARAYERYVQRHPAPLEAALQARWRLAALARAHGRPQDETRWLQAVQRLDAEAGAARSERTRTLGALAALRLAEPLAQAVRQQALVEPLKRNLERKQARFDAALRAYALATEGAPAEAQSASTYLSALLYQEFGHAVRMSQRPRALRGAPLASYEQQLAQLALPFEERAAALHHLNVERAAPGPGDEWVRKSQAALALLRTDTSALAAPRAAHAP